MTVGYLGPEGSFTHQAAMAWIERSGPGAVAETGAAAETRPLDSVVEVFDAVVAGSLTHGVVAVENTVEGYVVPVLDGLVGRPDVLAIDEVVLDITFHAFVRADHANLTEVCAHPHGLAQCQEFARRRGLRPVPASSNVAACRDIEAHQVALGPSICGRLYGLDVLEENVGDFHEARTRFLTIVRRGAETGWARNRAAGRWRTMLAITPTATGPGVLARLTSAFGARGVNLSSLITRPVKAVEGVYVFILTADAPAWDPRMREVISGLLAAGDAVKTLGVMPFRGELDEAVHQDIDPSQAPSGSAGRGSDADQLSRALLW